MPRRPAHWRTCGIKVRPVQSFVEQIVLHIPYFSVKPKLDLHMPSDKFYYSKWFCWYPYIFIGVVGSMNYYNRVLLLRFHHGRLYEPWEIVYFVFIIFFLVYNFFRYFLPMLRGKVFVEVDSEKISYYQKNKTIYWRDVTGVKYGDLLNAVTLKLRNKKKVRIYLRCIKGDDNEVLKSFSTYFKEAGNSEEPLAVTVG
jgi:hypothetical protein